ncbi:MAG: hypothetical protein GX759_01820 [Thermoanaerobacterales bacterium]|nr:hypothetical protein [Thermoanaerobacterales bacterium]
MAGNHFITITEGNERCASLDMRKQTSKLYSYKYPEKKMYKGVAEKLTP